MLCAKFKMNPCKSLQVNTLMAAGRSQLGQVLHAGYVALVSGLCQPRALDKGLHAVHNIMEKEQLQIASSSSSANLTAAGILLSHRIASAVFSLRRRCPTKIYLITLPCPYPGCHDSREKVNAAPLRYHGMELLPTCTTCKWSKSPFGMQSRMQEVGPCSSRCTVYLPSSQPKLHSIVLAR